MRSLVNASVVYLLALLLAATTPVGTGQGAHRDQLLDPLFPHVHPNADAPLTADHDRHPSLGTTTTTAVGAGAGAEAAGLGLTPPLPCLAWIGLATGGRRCLFVLEALPPRGLTLAPPDPPPTAA